MSDEPTVVPAGQDHHFDSPNRALLAVLQTDVHGYGTLISRDEEETAIRVTADLESFSEICRQHHGQVLHSRGDGLKMAFDSPVQAMRAALKMPQVARERNQERSNTRTVRHRMGLHFGDCVKLNGNITGHAVTIAARLEQMALPGQIAYSDQVRQLIQASVTHTSRYVGWEELKNLQDPVKVWMTRPDVLGGEIDDTPIMTPPPSRPRLSEASDNDTALKRVLGTIAIILTTALCTIAVGFAYLEYQKFQSIEKVEISSPKAEEPVQSSTPASPLSSKNKVPPTLPTNTGGAVPDTTDVRDVDSNRDVKDWNPEDEPPAEKPEKQPEPRVWAEICKRTGKRYGGTECELGMAMIPKSREFDDPCNVCIIRKRNQEARDKEKGAEEATPAPAPTDGSGEG